jgi:hypothetical protein
VVGEAYELKGKRARIGLRRCKACKKDFTVTVGTVFESSHVKLHLWFQAAYLLASSKKGISSHQLHRTLGVTYKTAWFMSHRLREAMKEMGVEPLGGEGMHVEVDETFIGKKRERRTRIDLKTGDKKVERGTGHKHAVMALVERGGRARSIHVKDMKRENLYAVMSHADRRSRLQTDEARHYWKVGREFTGGHGRVEHQRDEYVKGADHTNTIEGFFSIFKRGMKGVYQHCSGRHLQRYLAEFDFRYNARAALGVDDASRTERTLRGIAGKRLTYRSPDRKALRAQ